VAKRRGIGELNVWEAFKITFKPITNKQVRKKEGKGFGWPYTTTSGKP